MLHVIPRLLTVSATDKTAAYTTISTALRQAARGDTVFVAPGRYSPSQTGEEFPLYVPPDVSLLGAGRDDTIIDGEDAMACSFRPVREGQSLLLLGDDSTLHGFTVLGSGGNGIGNQPGARCQVLRNTIRQHGQHGIILSGPHEAIVQDNIFINNGTKRFSPVTPRPASARQGHHIFVQGKSGAANRVSISDNTMTTAFADGIAVVVFFDEGDGVQMHVRIFNNTIEQSERRGLTIAGAFGLCHSRVTIDVQHNLIRDNGALAIGAQAARPLVTQVLRDNVLRLRLIENACHNNGDGILLAGGFGPAEDNWLEATVVQNHITGASRYGVRILGGIGMGGYAAHNNRVSAVLSGNHIANAGGVPLLFQGGASEGQEDATGNAVMVQMGDNVLTTAAPQPALVLNDGLPKNTVQVAGTVPEHERICHAMPYEA